jgi:hypothetical protein
MSWVRLIYFKNQRHSIFQQISESARESAREFLPVVSNNFDRGEFDFIFAIRYYLEWRCGREGLS